MPPNFHSALHLHQGASMNVPFGSLYYECTVNAHSKSRHLALILFVKGIENMRARSESPRRKKKTYTVNPLTNRRFSCLLLG